MVPGSILALILLALPSAVFGVARWDPQLVREMKHGGESPIRTLIHLKDPVNPGEPAATADPRAVAKHLREHHRRSAAPVLRFLNSPPIAGRVKEIRSLWITHSLSVLAPASVLKALADFPQVESLQWERERELPPEISLKPWEKPTTPLRREVSWAATHVGATEVWRAGSRGKGVIVAVIDSGANTEHPDLAPNLWVNEGETGKDAWGRDRSRNGRDDDGNGYTDDRHGWNFEQDSADLTDMFGHGTQSAGVVAGMGAGGRVTGLAPEAQVMVLRACCLTGSKMFESHAWEAIQYAMAQGARVISMSLSIKHEANPNYAQWRRVGEALLAAGITHVNSVGNRGTESPPYNVGAPASNPPAWFHPEQPPGRPSSMISVGATDRTDTLQPFSSVGPVTWKSIAPFYDFPFEPGKAPGLTKPEVCGPTGLPSLSYDGESYTEHFGGTSAATPAVAAVVALLLSARPELTVAKVTEAIQRSAVPVRGGYSNGCGAGRVNAQGAFKYVRGR